jgi:hypothetical protein
MSESEKVPEVPEKQPFVTFRKTWKLFGFFSFSVTKTVTQQELIDDVSRKVLDEINAEMDKRFAPPPRRTQ